jgi:hypothetical protein
MRNFALTYPITVYSIDTDYSTGALKSHTFSKMPDQGAHFIKDGKLVQLNGGKREEFFIKKELAKKAGLKLTRARLKLLNQQVAELKKIFKETLKA